MISLEEFVKDHERALRNFALSLTRSEDESDDLLQDTWLKCIVYQQMLETMTVQKQRSWLFTVLKNRWLDICRHRKMERLALSGMQITNTATAPIYQMDTHLNKLPKVERDILYYKYWMGYNSRQIGTELDIPEGTVRWRLKLALDKMKVLIAQSEKEEKCLL